MQLDSIFAVICVSDIEKSKLWYGKLLGRSADDEPMDNLIQWRGLNGAGLQLVSDSDKAGNSLLTIIVPDLQKTRRKLASEGIELESDIQGDFGKLAQVSDPDGNRVTIAEAPQGT